jgi:hypothetical protein
MQRSSKNLLTAVLNSIKYTSKSQILVVGYFKKLEYIASNGTMPDV